MPKEASFVFVFVFFLRFYLFDTEKETAREGTQAEGVGEGEAGSPLSREPNVGLDPRTLGSQPEPKADASPTKPPRRHNNVLV